MNLTMYHVFSSALRCAILLSSLGWLLALPSGYANQDTVIIVEDLTLSQPSAQSASNNNQVYLDILSDMSALQREVGQLRGLVEELTYQLQRSQQQQQERYVELDERVLNLNQALTDSQGSGGDNTTSATARADQPGVKVPKITASTEVSATPGTSAVQAPSADALAEQQQAYKQAFDFVKQQEYSQAINAFQQFLLTWPDQPLSANAHYWLGEVFLVEKRYSDAVESFQVVINTFPGHRKVPDALYKAGRSLDLMQQADQAKEYYDRVINSYPDSSAARLAVRARKS